MAAFTLITRLRCDVEAAFLASLDIDLHLASMADSGERAVAGVTSGRIGPGQTVTWHARHFGIRWRMTSVISAYEHPVRFVDEQVSGPFRRWRHEHLFHPDGFHPDGFHPDGFHPDGFHPDGFHPDGEAGCLMTDHIDFEAPAGPLGKLVAAVVLKPYLRRLIERRNATLAEATAT